MDIRVETAIRTLALAELEVKAATEDLKQLRRKCEHDWEYEESESDSVNARGARYVCVHCAKVARDYGLGIGNNLE